MTFSRDLLCSPVVFFAFHVAFLVPAGFTFIGFFPFVLVTGLRPSLGDLASAWDSVGSKM